jgi:hypothetical protein
MSLSPNEKSMLRRLADEYAHIAALPVQQQTIQGWKNTNSRRAAKPMLLIYQIPWHEMNVAGELDLCCQDPFYREIEWQLRSTIYQWKHMRGDMVVGPGPVFTSPLVIRDSGFGISEDVDIVRTDDTNDVVSRRFHVQMQDEKDLEKILMPVVTHDQQATDDNAARLEDLFGDILNIVKTGVGAYWFAPWDELVRWWGVEELMRDLVDRPAFVNAAIGRLVTAYLCRLDQYEQLNLLDDSAPTIPGSGGYGYTDELPSTGVAPTHYTPKDQWGNAAAQIFGSISPRMHDEFALQHELRWLTRFGLTYYGCCDPLDNKLGILQQVTNLRKVSVSPWANIEKSVKHGGDRYVLSYKPNPALLAEAQWDPSRVRSELRAALEIMRGCAVEVILKDISTVNYQPKRLWEWAEIASQVTQEFA